MPCLLALAVGRPGESVACGSFPPTVHGMGMLRASVLSGFALALCAGALVSASPVGALSVHEPVQRVYPDPVGSTPSALEYSRQVEAALSELDQRAEAAGAKTLVVTFREARSYGVKSWTLRFSPTGGLTKKGTSTEGGSKYRWEKVCPGSSAPRQCWVRGNDGSAWEPWVVITESDPALDTDLFRYAGLWSGAPGDATFSVRGSTFSYRSGAETGSMTVSRSGVRIRYSDAEAKVTVSMSHSPRLVVARAPK